MYLVNCFYIFSPFDCRDSKAYRYVHCIKTFLECILLHDSSPLPIVFMQAEGPLSSPPPPPLGSTFYRGEGENVELGAVDEILQLHKKMNALKNPLGSRDSPARSCQDLLLENEEIENGSTYLINM